MTFASGSISSITTASANGTGHLADHNNIKSVLSAHDGILSTSASLAAAIDNDTGSGSLVFNTNPTFQGLVSGSTMSLTSGASVGGDLTVSGSIVAGGSALYVSASNLVLNDPLIYLAHNNPANISDIGIVGSFTSGNYQHTGIVRDATDSIWKLFSNVIPEPTTTLDFASATYDRLQLGGLIINSSSTTTTASITSAGAGTFASLTATGNSTFGNLATNAIYNQGFTGPNLNFGSSSIALRTQNSGTNTGLVIQSGSTSQTANLQEWQNSAGTILGSVGASGLFVFTSASLAAGTATIPALRLTSGTILTTPAAGAVEYDGTVAYLTTNTAASSRGIIPNLIFVTTASNRSLSAASTAQTIFDSANDIVSLAANTTYAVEMFFTMYNTATSSVAYTENLIFSTTGTPTYSFYVNYTGARAAPSNNGQTTYTAWTTASNTTLGPPGGSSSGVHSAAVFVKGLIRTTTSATFSPLIAFSAVPNPSSGSILANAYMHLNPIGSSAVVGLPAWQ